MKKYNYPKTSADWSGVEYLYNFLTKNKEIGPFAAETVAQKLLPGDVIQLSFDGRVFHHSTLVVKTDNTGILDNINIATHTLDSDFRAISTYNYQKMRFIHIEGVRF